jgi:hypothetical protein
VPATLVALEAGDGTTGLAKILTKTLATVKRALSVRRSRQPSARWPTGATATYTFEPAIVVDGPPPSPGHGYVPEDPPAPPSDVCSFEAIPDPRATSSSSSDEEDEDEYADADDGASVRYFALVEVDAGRAADVSVHAPSPPASLAHRRAASAVSSASVSTRARSQCMIARADAVRSPSPFAQAEPVRSASVRSRADTLRSPSPFAQAGPSVLARAETTRSPSRADTARSPSRTDASPLARSPPAERVRSPSALARAETTRSPSALSTHPSLRRTASTRHGLGSRAPSIATAPGSYPSPAPSPRKVPAPLPLAEPSTPMTSTPSTPMTPRTRLRPAERAVLPVGGTGRTAGWL